MPKQTITIEVDIPEGYEATGEYRAPNSQELFINIFSGNVISSDIVSSPRIILRKKWTPPAWIPEGAWLYKGTTDVWWLADVEPDEEPHNAYSTNGRGVVMLVSDLCSMFKYRFEVPKVNKVQIHH